jgi:hypothetical protein
MPPKRSLKPLDGEPGMNTKGRGSGPASNIAPHAKRGQPNILTLDLLQLPPTVRRRSAVSFPQEQTDHQSAGGNSIHMPSFPKERLSAGVAAAIAIPKQIGLRSLAAAKAAYGVIRGSDHIERRKQQTTAWNAAIDAAAYDCEQAALGHKLRAASHDPHDPFNLVADQLTRHAARIRLLKTETSRGRRFFEQAAETEKFGQYVQ